VNDVNSQPKRTVTFGRVSTIDRSSGSRCVLRDELIRLEAAVVVVRRDFGFGFVHEGHGRRASGGPAIEVARKTSIGALRGRPASRTFSAITSRR